MDEQAASGEIVTGTADFTQRAIQLVQTARGDVSIFSRVLDRRIYATEDMIDAIRGFALQHRRARVRALVHSPTMRGGNRLVELGRVLSSRIQFRELLPDRRDALEEYMVGDEHSVLFKDSHDALEARWYAEAPLEARLRLRKFNMLWDESLPVREFQVLGI